MNRILISRQDDNDWTQYPTKVVIVLMEESFSFSNKKRIDFEILKNKVMKNLFEKIGDWPYWSLIIFEPIEIMWSYRDDANNCMNIMKNEENVQGVMRDFSRKFHFMISSGAKLWRIIQIESDLSFQGFLEILMHILWKQPNW